jgi:hypothetical protein
MLILLVWYAIILHRRLVGPVSTLGSVETQQGPGNDCTASRFLRALKLRLGRAGRSGGTSHLLISFQERRLD